MVSRRARSHGKGRGLAVATGLLGDRLLGEPPDRTHPVALFGRTMEAIERRTYRDTRAGGLAYAATGLGLGLAAGLITRSTAGATCTAVGGRALADAAHAVATALDDGDLDRARTLLPALVGRDPSGLDEKEISRAVVESVAENTVDAIVAPAFWAVVAGAPGALGYRAINTLDAMVGHHSPRYEHFGWASARLDDAAGWIPARLTAALVAAVRPRAASRIWTAVRRDAPSHPSPNAGVAEAAFAAALGLRLGGESRYHGRTEVRPPLGDGRPAERKDIDAAVRLSRDVTLLLGITAVMTAR